MLALQQALEIKESILAYLRATYSFQDKRVEGAFFKFVEDPVDGVFKGPYVSLKLPFVQATEAESASIPLTVKPNWPPYDHQIKAWHRLSSTEERQPKPTLITTGTGSGKTESFLYPLLDHCYRNKQAGIKVIILYPMNALATDQAKRLAEAIFEDERLRGRISAGLFIGEGKNAAKYPKTMGASNIIEHREAILADPPDILLTNFKMLDYGLMRSNFHRLWVNNLQDPTLLRYLVLDELHTYDGAQGTDVANLIRRLKLKLGLQAGQLCPVGTSATMGSGADSKQLLSEYATKIFGEVVDQEAIITENRISAEEFFPKEQEHFIPRAQKLKETLLRPNEQFEAYLARQVQVWQLNTDSLADDMRALKVVKDLVAICNEGKGIHTLAELEAKLSDRNAEFKAVPQWDEKEQFAPKDALIGSLLGLISVARIGDKKKTPFLFSQAQLWVRELSGVLRMFTSEPRFAWREEVEAGDAIKKLPPWFCRECGASGWLGLKHDNKDRFETVVNDVYEKYFSNHKHIHFINDATWFSINDLGVSGYQPTDVVHKHVYNRNLEFYDGADEGRVEVVAVRKLNAAGFNDHVCPECNTRNTVAIIGARVATLSSIAVSQSLATDLDLRPEKERKVLAFTNSVQDAAHHAGFVEARNYNFTLRASVQKVLNELGRPVPLDELGRAFITYWKAHSDESGTASLNAYYHRFYPKDQLGKSTPEDYGNKGVYQPRFQAEFDLRMLWEVYAEFGYNARIGRTLEKTGASAVQFRAEDLMAVWQVMKDWLKANEMEGRIEQGGFLSFLTLVLERMRTRGAITHPHLEKFRTNSLKFWDLNWQRDGRHFLNRRYGPTTRIPSLITTQADNHGGLLDSTFSKRVNWFHVYFKKSFPLAANHPDAVNEFYAQLVSALHKQGVLDHRQAGDTDNYALHPARLLAANTVLRYTCGKCEHEVLTSATEDTITGGKCINYRCPGEYAAKGVVQGQNYYRLVYNRERSPRIYAADHTGLLERKKRELLEIDFKTRPHFNSKNVLVATSTLEMGIDIGSLNTAINNSVPPLPGNFLQRVGRAGRTSGSAVIVNFSRNDAHDLFYYREPLDMMAGEVATPGCYLEAKEILKRHFFAFTIDSWTTSDPKSNSIPSLIRSMKLETSDLEAVEFFMNRITAFMKTHEEELFQRFRSQYVGQVDPAVFDELNKALVSEELVTFYRSIFPKLKDELHFLRKKQKELEDRIKERGLGENDPERKELQSEIRDLRGLAMGIQRRNTLEHLTNVGALPNYAFPESGVKLAARVMGRSVEGGTQPPLNQEFEIVRGASSAIRELAPDNLFYSQGFKFKVTGVNTFEWADKDNLHEKRFCSACDHIEQASTAPAGPCPKCGDPSFGAASNVHKFARMTSVRSYNDRLGATLSDTKDEREKVYYNTQAHFHMDPKGSRGGYAMKEIPFGIEFVKNVRITSTNLGNTKTVNARKSTVNEREVATHGFVTCKHCGRSTSDPRAMDNKVHYGFCKHKEDAYVNAPNEVFEELFFYREVTTEAMKILLPVQEFNTEAEVKMFQAGIQLGLKKYYRGSPDHIHLAAYKEYNQRTSRFDRYLILYDSVPGGTGYLEKLFETGEFNRLLHVAYETIRDCSCQQQGKDGCYRCIFSYGNQYHREELSRAASEAWFKKIVEKSNEWEFQPEGLGKITNTGQIEESELELKFIRALRNYAKRNDAWDFEQVNESGTVSYKLRYQTGETSFSYHIRPQVPLGAKDGVELNTTPDFLVICTEGKLNGRKLTKPMLKAIPKIGIYLDGYLFHASPENNRFMDDVAKRLGLLKSGNFLTWTLTWNDMERFEELFKADADQLKREDPLALKLKEPGFAASARALLQANKTAILDLHLAKNSMERLLELFKHPLRDEKFNGSWSLYLGLFQKQLFAPSFSPADKERAFAGIEQSDRYCLDNKTLDGWVVFQGLSSMPLFSATTIVNIAERKADTRLTFGDTTVIDKEEWSLYWSYFNLYQGFGIVL